MIIFGSRKSNRVMGQMQYTCSRCKQQAYHTIVRNHHWITLYFIPIIPISKTTFSYCNFCSYQIEIENAQANAWFQQAKKSDPGTSLKGADLYYELTITFEEALFGCQKEIELFRWESCLTCRGEGGVITARCENCHGQGRVHNNRRMVVNIPAGVDNRVQVRVMGEGEVSVPNVPPGNLHVVLTVKPHPLFKRQGKDIIYELSINSTQATLGDLIEVPIVDGKTVPLKIPAGTQSNNSFCLKGLGVPVMNNTGRGDYYIIVKVV